jgi:hypothetical protein
MLEHEAVPLSCSDLRKGLKLLKGSYFILAAQDVQASSSYYEKSQVKSYSCEIW